MTIRDRYPDMEKPARFDSARLQVDEIKMFPPLTSEAKASPDILGYLRTGGCTAGCGACCEAFVIPLDPDAIEAVDFEHVKSSGRVQVPVDSTVIGKAGTADWEYWLRLHDTTIFQLPSGVLTADLPVEAGEGPGEVTVDEWFAWLEKQHIAVLRREGQQMLAYITRKCDELGEDGLCQVFNTSRPEMCSGYPEHPMDVQGINFCTYNFAPVSRNEVIARNIVGMGRGQPKPPKKKGKRKKKGKKR